jgi:hypothetical protein
MGLDNFVSRTPERVALTPEDERAFAESGIELCGGVYSDGQASIRGKLYDSFVLEVADESLYQEWIPPETMTEIARRLAACDPETATEGLDLGGERFTPTPQEVRMLQAFFDLCAQRGLGLIGWW